jgi:predicted MarR family transcription regulator
MTPEEQEAFDASEERRIRVEEALSWLSLEMAKAAGCQGAVTGEQLIARVSDLREREQILIDLCHTVDQALQRDPPMVQASLEALETVRLWWYPVPPS